MEVMASLASLLEARTLYLPGRATTLRAPSTFRLWATLTTGARASAVAASARVFRSALWQHVAVDAPSYDDLVQTVATRHPRMAYVADMMVRTLHLVLRATGSAPADACLSMASAALEAAANASSIDGGEATRAAEAASGGVNKPPVDASTAFTVDDVDAAEAEAQLESARCALGASGRGYSSRDLLKWASRVDCALHAASFMERALPPPSDARLTGQLREMILLEALDVFVWAVRRAGPRRQLAELLARHWRVPSDRLHHLLELQRPAYTESAGRISVGRVSLLRASDSGGSGGGPTYVRFANTRHTLCVMERVAACIRMSEPVLLVGETGTGKTTVVQQLARAMGKTMLVHNLSEQSDSSELLGGFRPVQPRQVSRSDLNPWVDRTHPHR